MTFSEGYRKVIKYFYRVYPIFPKNLFQNSFCPLQGQGITIGISN